MIHQTAIIEKSARLGKNLTIGPNAVIGDNVTIGDNCIIDSGVNISRNSILESGVIIGSNTVFIEANIENEETETIIKKMVKIGPNTTIYPNIIVGESAAVKPGTVLMRTVPPYAIVEGNPATIVGYIDTIYRTNDLKKIPAIQKELKSELIGVKGVTYHNFPIIPDLRGNLTVGEFNNQIPFEAKRYFLIYGVPTREVRGEHAHRLCHQFLICIHGHCSIVTDDGNNRVEILLDSPNKGLYLPPMTWSIQYQYSQDAILLVFASHYYDSDDYIRDYENFILELKSNKK